ncbi:5-formyltetrahydrofolate cyclo-ligase, partial [Acinetobacter baumannii]|nr:5-formyltetrahydrofolate cyclo-ligase [Acinetobacter baumannii]
LGLAHQFQFIEHTLERQSWDQPLDGLLTPQHFYYFKR